MMVATPIWIAGYGHQPTGSTASPIRMVSSGRAPNNPPGGLTEAWIVGYGHAPATGPTVVWVTSAAGTTPVWIAGVGGAVRG